MRKHAKPVVQRLSSTDRRRLERALLMAREARLYRRIEAVLLVAEGQPISEAARRVRATRFSVRGWVGRYLATHDAATLADGVSGGVTIPTARTDTAALGESLTAGLGQSATVADALAVW